MEWFVWTRESNSSSLQMYLFRTYICMGCVMWADAGECFWKWEWISTYMHLCDAWESICINPQLYFFWKENICMGCVMWAARSQTPSFCSSSSPQTSKLPDWRTGLSSFTSKHVLLQTRRNYNFKWKFKKRKENWSKSTTLQFISVQVHQVYLLCFSSGDTHIQHVSGRSVLLR